jgi:hypothetical protein
MMTFPVFTRLPLAGCRRRRYPAYTSAAVEGINNKARVITKRCYGVKSSGTLWNRLILDLNGVSEAAGRSIAEVREIVSGLKAVFLAFCT